MYMTIILKGIHNLPISREGRRAGAEPETETNFLSIIIGISKFALLHSIFLFS